VGSHDERSLVEQCRSGNRQAFGALFEAHHRWAYRLSYRLTGSHADADDVLQESWLHVLRGMSQFDGRAGFGRWLARIIVRVAISKKRRGMDRRARRDLDSEKEPQAGTGSDPRKRAEVAELNAALRRAMSTLPPAQRAALVLVALEGFSYAEAAEILQCPEGTLAWRVAEARRKLAERLVPYLE